jgi:hypothetical protein
MIPRTGGNPIFLPKERSKKMTRNQEMMPETKETKMPETKNREGN